MFRKSGVRNEVTMCRHSLSVGVRADSSHHHDDSTGSSLAPGPLPFTGARGDSALSVPQQTDPASRRWRENVSGEAGETSRGPARPACEAASGDCHAAPSSLTVIRCSSGDSWSLRTVSRRR